MNTRMYKFPFHFLWWIGGNWSSGEDRALVYMNISTCVAWHFHFICTFCNWLALLETNQLPQQQATASDLYSSSKAGNTKEGKAGFPLSLLALFLPSSLCLANFCRLLFIHLCSCGRTCKLLPRYYCRNHRWSRVAVCKPVEAFVSNEAGKFQKDLKTSFLGSKLIPSLSWSK